MTGSVQVNQGKNHARSLSTLKFKDRFGNDIGTEVPGKFNICYIELRVLILASVVEPDLTNPTRHRWERPLDTIRGFEAAIYKDEYRGSYVGTYLPFPLHV